ncbi:hypothetical protein IEQ34_018543 [Dendrobium chrysotoxum]|uniref:RNase H type-1 domain-containing protein n=1 Tax=Dendrobium chrysotoxum TaxID=161865 RepID=A0AAV7FNT2_DENCH|nr:hypothetical protein IEQ34_018543 [Dendrobium chrysotoxum]
MDGGGGPSAVEAASSSSKSRSACACPRCKRMRKEASITIVVHTVRSGNLIHLYDLSENVVKWYSTIRIVLYDMESYRTICASAGIFESLIELKAVIKTKLIKCGSKRHIHNYSDARIGGIFRDHHGRFMLAFGIKYMHWDMSRKELVVVTSLTKIFQDWMLDSKGIIIEGDNINIIHFLHNTFNNSKCCPKNPLLKELKSNWFGPFTTTKLCKNFWHPPPPDWIKINFDASILKNNEARIGGIFRDHHGRFILAFEIKYMHWDRSRKELVVVTSLTKIF